MQELFELRVMLSRFLCAICVIIACCIRDSRETAFQTGTILIAHQEMNANVLHAQLAPVFQEAIDFKRLRRLKREIGGAP